MLCVRPRNQLNVDLVSHAMEHIMRSHKNRAHVEKRGVNEKDGGEKVLMSMNFIAQFTFNLNSRLISSYITIDQSN